MLCVLPFSVLTSETQLDLPHTENNSRGAISRVLALRMGFSPHTLDWSRPGSEQWSVPCTRLHSKGAERRTERAQRRQRGLYARGSPLARVPKAWVRAGGMWEGVFKHTSCPFRLRAPIIYTLTSQHQGEHKKRLERKSWWESKYYCFSNLGKIILTLQYVLSLGTAVLWDKC